MWTKNRDELPIALRHPVSCFLAAFRFLTIIPIYWKSDRDGDYFQHSLFYFPVIGALIGVVAGGLTVIFKMFLPIPVVAVLSIVVLALVSGCLHLDGLADTADGFFSSRPKERILEIMRDSRTGAMGVIGIVMIILAKYAALVSLTPSIFVKTVCLMPVAGRCAIVLTMSVLPYAREEGGLGDLFYSRKCRLAAIWSLVFVLILIPLAGFETVFIMLGTMLSVVFFFALWCRRKIGGATGDTLGAICEITEAAVALALTTTLIVH